MKILAIIVFIAMYVLMTMFLSKRIFIVFAAAAIFLITGILGLRFLTGQFCILLIILFSRDSTNAVCDIESGNERRLLAGIFKDFLCLLS